MSSPWFGPKTFGIGLAPASAAGWIFLAVYLVAMLVAPMIARLLDAPGWALQWAFGALTLGFVLVALVKSDRGRWR